MADRKKRRRHGQDEQEKAARLNQVYRPTSIGSVRVNEIASRAHKDLDDVIWHEPQEDLEESELSDWERRQAIERERTRREGLI